MISLARRMSSSFIAIATVRTLEKGEGDDALKRYPDLVPLKLLVSLPMTWEAR